MSYEQYRGRDFDREQFERWQRHGRERGWLDRSTDEVRSWFGDDDAQYRRMLDEREQHRQNIVGGSDTGFDSRGYNYQRDNNLYGRERLSGSTYGGRYGSDFERTNDMLSREEYLRRNRMHNFDNGYRTSNVTNSSLSGQWPWSNTEDDQYKTFGRTGVDSLRGRGPKNFKRSDERINEEVHEQLAQHHEIDATEIMIEVKDGEVTLRGTVDSRFEKRMAEDIVEDIFGVKHVQNMIRINENSNLNLRNNTDTRTPSLTANRR